MNSKECEKENDLKLSKSDFYFKTSLYDEIKNIDLKDDLFTGDVEGYNPFSKKETTFCIKRYNLIDYVETTVYSNGISKTKREDDDLCNLYLVKLKCKRNNKDVLTFFVYSDGDTVVKLGQKPSLADIEFLELNKKYDKVLDKNNLKLFKKAIGLFAHGAGAGSFVYLRKIFEGLIQECFGSSKGNLSVNDSKFKGMSVSDKIDLLKDYLPDKMIELKPLYGILSQGVHELSEEQCLMFFPALKLSIELILDQKIYNEEKIKREKVIKKQLLDINSKIKGGKNDK